MHLEDTRFHTGHVSPRSKNRRVSKKDPIHPPPTAPKVDPGFDPPPSLIAQELESTPTSQLSACHLAINTSAKAMAEDGVYEGPGSLDDEGDTKLQWARRH
jgi:hypothetical protein